MGYQVMAVRERDDALGVTTLGAVNSDLPG